MLNAHPEVAVPPESRFIVELWKGDEVIDADGFLATLASHKRFIAWDLPIATVTDELGHGQKPYAECIAATYRAYAHVHGKTLWGDKTPRYIESLPLLARLFPEASFIHLVRDGRDVALSYADVPFGPKTIAKAASLWRERVLVGVETGRPLGSERYLELRYESLVSDANEEIKALCEWLGFAFDPGMLDYTEKARESMLPRAEKYNPHLTESPTRRTRDWSRDMPESQVEVFEAVAGDALERLGYERRYPAPATSARIKAALGRYGVPVGKLQSHR